ncbi:hypothetical protein ACFX58_03365 [Sphingomonas sp. NCPPB 2930]
MTYALLEKLDVMHLPVEIDGPEVDMIRAYVAAGLVVADIRQPVCARDGAVLAMTARVEALTRAGRRTVEKRRAHRSTQAFLRKL